MTVLYGVGVWVAFNFGFVGLLAFFYRRGRPVKGQGAPRWAPDPAFDPALREDLEVADLDALYEMDCGVPRAW
jgi:hypothetical protein